MPWKPTSIVLYPFTDVCKTLSAEIKRHPLYARFYIDTPRAGETYSYERGEKIIRWDHFMLNIPNAYVRNRQEIAGLKGAYNDDRKCFQRARCLSCLMKPSPLYST